ncbi:MAG TPA: hypothetical protein VE131_05990 [Terriglobales bacterium]|nr:hypothetical protein [Terriglobales bacterium]
MSSLIPLLDPLIQRLHHPGVHGGDDVYGGVELFLGHACFPCVRKAALHSGVTKAHHGDRQAHEHFFPVSEALDGMGITVKCSEVGLFHDG